MTKAKQMSESIQLGILLALAGGFLDAYSYVCRGHVFSNAQTGNILLMAVNLSTGSWGTALRYLLPVCAFAAGIALADAIRARLRHLDRFHWRQITILAEMAALAAVGFFPLSCNLPANALASFACGIQVESFRKIGGNGVATTMCIGNLRAATQAITEYRRTRDRAAVRRGLFFYGIIGCFAAGAVLGNFAVELLGPCAIWADDGLLAAAGLLMCIDRERTQRQTA